MVRGIFLVLALLTGAETAAAQNALGVVMRRSTAEAGLDAYFQGGRQSRLLLSAHANLARADSQFTIYVRPSATIARTGGQLTDLEPQLQTFVYRHHTARYYAFVVSIIDHSRIRRVDRRMRTGAGAGVRLRESRGVQVRAALGPLHEWTRFDEGAARSTTRAMLYVMATIARPRLRQTAEFIWAQHPTNRDDWQARVRISTALPVTRRLSFRVFLEHTQEQMVAENTEQGEFRLTAGALYSLAR